jgi:EAL domain-containing protein (putative c-di-GMP-specific phosphodiesterase class I)/GGDEF domain-containing protein
MGIIRRPITKTSGRKQMGADLPALTGEWLRGITSAGFVPGVRARARAALHELLEELIAAVRAEPFDPAVGDRIGAELVDLRMSAPPVIGMTVRLLASRLPEHIGGDPEAVRERVLELLEHVTVGFVTAQRNAAVGAAEQMNRSEKIHWRRVQTDLQRRLLHDPVTDLPNEQQLRSRLGEATGLCLLGVDRFAELADTLGHDTLLTAVASMLSQLGGDFLAHLGNDQFALLADSQDLIKVADEARRVLRPMHVDVTAGLVEHAVGRTPDDWLRDARLALGWARQDHRDHAVFEPGRAESDRRRHRLAADLPSAVETGEFVAHYQPLYRLSDRAVIGVEALARWQRPGGPLLGPPDFITLAEHTGLIRPLGRHILERACRQGALWRQAGHPLLISVNLSPLQLSEPTLPADVADILHRAGLPAASLQLEITESAALDDGYATLQQLAELGVRLALDDFGTGYSSLATLSWLPLNNVKLAAEFMTGAGGTAVTEVLRHTIELCHALGLTVTAEGIETAAQESLLRSLNCDFGQGFHYARPTGSPDTVIARATRHHPT